MDDLDFQARSVGALLDPISNQIARTMDAECDPQNLLTLMQLRQHWHRSLCELLRTGMDEDMLPPEDLINEFVQDISQETKLLQVLAKEITRVGAEETQQYAFAWMKVREMNEQLIDFYTEYTVD
jgi:hypothetical protein